MGLLKYVLHRIWDAQGMDGSGVPGILGRDGLKRKNGRKMVCRRCGSRVRPEREAGLREEYPYYCPQCDENMYSFECMEDSCRQ